jgi:hypothetical protein
LSGEKSILYRSAAGSAGGFALRVTVGKLTNEYQGKSCRIRFIFRIVRDDEEGEEGDIEQAASTVAPEEPNGGHEPPNGYTPSEPSDVVDTNIPSSESVGREYWSLLSLIMSIVAMLISLAYVGGAYSRHRDIKTENEQRRDIGIEEEARLSGGMWKVIAVAAGVLTPVVWLLLDDLRDPMTFINSNTKWVAQSFIIHLIFALLYQVRKNKTRESVEQ